MAHFVAFLGPSIYLTLRLIDVLFRCGTGLNTRRPCAVRYPTAWETSAFLGLLEHLKRLVGMRKKARATSHMSSPHLKERDLAEDQTTCVIFLASTKSLIFCKALQTYVTLDCAQNKSIQGNEEPRANSPVPVTLRHRGF